MSYLGVSHEGVEKVLRSLSRCPKEAWDAGRLFQVTKALLAQDEKEGGEQLRKQTADAIEIIKATA